MWSSIRVHGNIMRTLLLSVFVWGVVAGVARAQVAPPPAYLAVVEGNVTLEREGEVVPAEQNMPFVQGDRLRTADGRAQIAFPDGTAIEVAENSEVECISPTRVRLLAGTMDHVRRAVGGSQSASYLPPELDVYGTTLDQYGSWQYDAPYGYVWYPSTVAADWRPYYYGYWSPVPTYGWTWIGVDTWAWPTHHYGRWGYARNRWFWIPGRSWGPAWVSWASAPGYVSWCPLGFDSRPVFALSVGFGGRNRWDGWTVLPRGNFGAHRYYANRFGVDPGRIPATAAFVGRSAPPTPTRAGRVNVNNAPTVGIAVPRQTQQSPVPSRQSPVSSRQSPVDTRQSPASGGQGRIDGWQPTVGERRMSPSADAQVPTHYGMAVPRATTPSPATGRPAQSPDYHPTAPDYRRPTPGYRSPNDYRIQRMDPRMSPSAPNGPAPRAVAPAAPSGPPPRIGAPSRDRGPAPMAVPRTPPPSAAPTGAPAQPAPGASPSHARPAPPNAAPQGEARPRGEGRGRPR